MRTVFLETVEKNVQLVLLNECDVPTLVHGMNNRDITQFLLRGHFPMDETSEREWVASLRGDYNNLVFGIWLPKEDTLIGTVGLHNINHKDQVAELGIAIYDSNYHGKGVGTCVIRLMLGHAFDRLNLRGVVLGVLSNNPRGKRCYEKCGFEEVGRLPKWVFKDGQWHDHIHMVRTGY